jgi:hypothetical protein
MQWYFGFMTEEQRFEQFIELCKRIFERMEREDTWPWPGDETQDPQQHSGGDISNE